MPIHLDRRGFLKQLAAFAAAWSLSANLNAADAQARVALLSDTHISADQNDTYRGFSPHANLQKVCDQVRAAPKFDLMVVNGDLARLNGQQQDYAAFVSYLDPLAETMPLVITMGNHDDRKNARNAVVKRAGDLQAVEQKLVTVIDAGPCQFILLDSLMVTAISAGQLGKSQRAWLAGYLDEQSSGKPVVVFVHHNPDAESDGALVDADKLLAILKPKHAVKALLFGHTHVYSFDKQDGMHLVNLPAVGYNFADGHPVGWTEGTFSKQGMSVTLHAIAGETKNDGKTVNLSWRG
jgi:3',5'-cyclic AMP phosphodiesterase CpdA